MGLSFPCTWAARRTFLLERAQNKWTAASVTGKINSVVINVSTNLSDSCRGLLAFDPPCLTPVFLGSTHHLYARAWECSPPKMYQAEYVSSRLIELRWTKTQTFWLSAHSTEIKREIASVWSVLRSEELLRKIPFSFTSLYNRHNPLAFLLDLTIFFSYISSILKEFTSTT